MKAPLISSAAISELGRRTSRFLSASLCFSSLVFASSCSTAHYLYQASKGQLYLSTHTRSIDDVLHDEKTPPRIKKILAEISRVKAFGETEGLRPTHNYTDYVALDRTAAVWVVSACAPLKFEPREWHFPLVGSFPYLGFFDLEDARKYAAELKQESGSYDVDLRGARAYSTLGWFRDAVLSTMIPAGEEAMGEVVNVVIHESTHATVYIKGQAFFDESLASFVAEKLTPVYLEQTGQTGAEQAYVKSEKDSAEFVKSFHDAYLKLDTLYASARPDEEKLAEKKKILTELQTRLGFKREINNATLIQYKEYSEGNAFEPLYAACGQDMKRFIQVLKRVSSSSFKSGQQDDLAPVIQPLVAQGC